MKPYGLLFLLAMLALPMPARAQNVLKFYAGAQGIWYDNAARPSDFEAGGNVRASLSPHISAVSSAYYGFANSYVRGTVGVRVTATDVSNPDFSIGLGACYHASSEPKIHAEEWAPDASLGWRPWPRQLPAVTLIAQGYYGMKSNQAYMVLGARYALGAD